MRRENQPSEVAGNRMLDAEQMRAIRLVLHNLLSADNPLVAIAGLIKRTSGTNISAFERYCGQTLANAASVPPAKLAAMRSVRLLPPGRAKLARLMSSYEQDESDRRLLSRLEDALNRLVCIVDALEDGIGGQNDGRTGDTSISRFGVGYLPQRQGHRSANLVLPEIGRVEIAPVSYFNEIDWRVFDHIANNAHAVFQNSITPNVYRSLLGVVAPEGGDWDIRTRLATILEELELPLRYAYRFDCDVEAHAASVHFTIPDARAFPPVLGQAGENDAPAGIEDARMAYALRLACLAGSAVFGSNRHMRHAYVTAWDGDWKRPVASCSFERDEFVRTTLLAIDSGLMSAPTVRFAPERIAQIAKPHALDYIDLRDNAACAEVVDDGMAAHRIEPWQDERPLPDQLGALFGARTVSGLDAARHYGEDSERIDAAQADVGESPMAAIATLEQIAEELERTLEDDVSTSGARPLYCDSFLSRAALPLAFDQLLVAHQAEAFLDPDTAVPALEFARVPSALYHAHMGLSDAYERLGDYRGAEAHADRCVTLAPTTLAAHFRKADIVARQGRFTEAANVVVNALDYAIADRDCAQAYFRLGLYLWHGGYRREACVAYVYATSFEGAAASRARQVVAALRKDSKIDLRIPVNVRIAEQEMRRMGIPVVPSMEAQGLVARAAMGLADANAPLAAAPYASALSRWANGGPPLEAACASLEFGTADPYRAGADALQEFDS